MLLTWVSFTAVQLEFVVLLKRRRRRWTTNNWYLSTWEDDVLCVSVRCICTICTYSYRVWADEIFWVCVCVFCFDYNVAPNSYTLLNFSHLLLLFFGGVKERFMLLTCRNYKMFRRISLETKTKTKTPTHTNTIPNRCIVMNYFIFLMTLYEMR